MTPKREKATAVRPSERVTGERRETRAIHLLPDHERAAWDNERKARGLPARGPAEASLLDAERRHLEDPQGFSHEQLLAARRMAYRERISAMPIPRAVAEWASRMTARYGPTVGLHLQPALDWVTALVIVRWGEDPEKWPAKLTEEDAARALAWESGKRPPVGVRLTSPGDAAAPTYTVEEG